MRDSLKGSAARFVAGFLLASIGSVVIVYLLQGLRGGFGFLIPMSAVGIFVGVLFVRWPPKFFTGTGTDFGSSKQ